MFAHKQLTTVALRYGPLALALCIGIVIKNPLDKIYRKTFPQTQPDQIDLLLKQGIDLQAAGKLKEAISTYKQLLTTNPAITQTLVRLGSAASELKDYNSAITYYKSAITIAPNHLGAYGALSANLRYTKEYAQAAKYATMGVSLVSDYYDGYFQLSKAQTELAEFEQAIKNAQKAITLQPNNIHAYLNLGHIHNRNGTLDDAVAMYKKALEITPEFPNALYNLGYTLRIQKKTDEALTYLLRAAELQANYVDAHVAIAQAYWSQKKFDVAWQEYEWRWKLLGIDPHAMSTPLWDGCDLKGKTIVLYCEQGLGDTLQFVRYTKLVKEKGATVVCKVQKPLLTLLAQFPHIDKLISSMAETKGMHIDYQAPLLNLPGILKTREHTIPADIPYLKADPKLISLWKSKLAHDTKFKIGLCWHVDPHHEVDKSPWEKRTVTIDLFTQLSRIANTSFYSLQKINGEDQLKNLPESFVVKTFDQNFDEKHGRFMDTAAVIMNLDLVITVDTSVAHLAAGMGKKVWMLLPYTPDPRWYNEGQATPWYPNMRLFRQPKPYDWQSVGNELKVALAALVK
ncbi:MAG: tetratricopeptide repeat protein [Candidatus Dependentiae bacterium]|nr:tetratricopeptide repeat protein [Candidatus Dependentiae bacterium]